MSNQPQPEQAVRSPKPRVLFADDHADTVEMVCLLLQTEGFEVVATSDALEALQLAEQQQFDVFLFDLFMPETSGFELCEQIRKFDSGTPIVIYSGVGSESYKERAIAAGAQLYVTKAAGMCDLVEVLRSAINTHWSNTPSLTHTT